MSKTFAEEQAEREVDALVAEHILGWTWSGEGFSRSLGSPNGESFCYRREIGGWYTKNLPRFYTEVVSAWIVICEMEKQGWRWSVGKGEAGHVARFSRPIYEEQPDGRVIYKRNEIHQHYVESLEKIPEAVCRAALSAKGVKIDG